MSMEGKRNPRAKFVELANARVARVIKDLQLVGNLANRKNYEYSEEEAKKIIKAIEGEFELLRMKFKSQPTPRETLFKL